MAGYTFEVGQGDGVIAQDILLQDGGQILIGFDGPLPPAILIGYLSVRAMNPVVNLEFEVYNISVRSEGAWFYLPDKVVQNASLFTFHFYGYQGGVTGTLAA